MGYSAYMTRMCVRLTALFLLCLAPIAHAQERDRAKIADKYKWNLAEIYPTEQDWEKTRQQITVDIGKIGARPPGPRRAGGATR